jgi:hypothetical protein
VYEVLLLLPHEHVLKQSYNCLKELYELGKNNWCTYVHGIALETGFESVWISQELDSKTLGLMKEKLFKNCKGKCMNNIQDSECFPKLRTYKKFKINFREEVYLSIIKDYRYICILFFHSESILYKKYKYSFKNIVYTHTSFN